MVQELIGNGSAYAAVTKDEVIARERLPKKERKISPLAHLN